MLHGIGELLVEVFGEGWARVVGEDANEHDGIVLDMRSLVVLLGEELADLRGCCGGRRRAALSCFDDGREMEDFLALRLSVHEQNMCVVTYRVSCSRFTEQPLSSYQLSRSWRDMAQLTTPRAAFASGVSALLSTGYSCAMRA
jgi:hypothetical protein